MDAHSEVPRCPRLAGRNPAHDEPVHLPSGRTVQLYNLLAARKEGGPPSLSIQYGSTLSASDTVARRAEAGEVIRHFAELLERIGATSASAQICATRAQAETRDPPEQSFWFHRTADGTWQGSE